MFADAKSKIYGESDPELTFTAEGLVTITDDEGVEQLDQLKGELTREKGDHVGTYDILEGNLKESNPNYDITFQKKAVAFKIVYSKTKGSGKATFTKVKGSKKIKVGKTGKVKIMKGTRNGIYKIKVKVSVAANTKYKAKAVTKTIKIKIKK